jgi:hypothetical protein
MYRRTRLESAAGEGESPVIEMHKTGWVSSLSRAGHEKSCLNPGRPLSKAKYTTATDSA